MFRACMYMYNCTFNKSRELLSLASIKERIELSFDNCIFFSFMFKTVFLKDWDKWENLYSKLVIWFIYSIDFIAIIFIVMQLFWTAYKKWRLVEVAKRNKIINTIPGFYQINQIYLLWWTFPNLTRQLQIHDSKVVAAYFQSLKWNIFANNLDGRSNLIHTNNLPFSRSSRLPLSQNSNKKTDLPCSP